VGAPAGDAFAFKINIAGIRLYDGRDNIKQGGFPRAIGTENPYDFPAFQVQAYVVQCQQTTKILPDSIETKDDFGFIQIKCPKFSEKQLVWIDSKHHAENNAGAN
jgi:hypothetical protein